MRNLKLENCSNERIGVDNGYDKWQQIIIVLPIPEVDYYSAA